MGDRKHICLAQSFQRLGYYAIHPERLLYFKISIYGKSAFGLAQDLGMQISEAATFIDEYFERYAGVKRYLEHTKELARTRGYTETILGRRCYFPDITSKNQTIRQFAERAAINAPIQGSAADLIKVAMIRIQAALEKEDLHSKMILQVHDELVFDAVVSEKARVCSLVTTYMESAAALSVPLVVNLSWGKSWAKL